MHSCIVFWQMHAFNACKKNGVLSTVSCTYATQCRNTSMVVCFSKSSHSPNANQHSTTFAKGVVEILPEYINCWIKRQRNWNQSYTVIVLMFLKANKTSLYAQLWCCHVWLSMNHNLMQRSQYKHNEKEAPRTALYKAFWSHSQLLLKVSPVTQQGVHASPCFPPH